MCLPKSLAGLEFSSFLGVAAIGYTALFSLLRWLEQLLCSVPLPQLMLVITHASAVPDEDDRVALEARVSAAVRTAVLRGLFDAVMLDVAGRDGDSLGDDAHYAASWCTCTPRARSLPHLYFMMSHVSLDFATRSLKSGIHSIICLIYHS